MVEGLAADILHGRSLAGYPAEILNGLFVSGVRYHLWFFPAMIFSAIVFTLAHKLRLQKVLVTALGVLYLLGVLFSGAYGIQETDLPVISAFYQWDGYFLFWNYVMRALTAFSMGYLLNHMRNLGQMNNKKLWSVFIAALALYVGETYVMVHVRSTGVHLLFTTYPALLVLAVFLFNHPLAGRAKAGRYCHALANFTYYSHPLFIDMLRLCAPLISTALLNGEAAFFATWAFTTIAGLLLIRLNNKQINKLISMR